MAEESSTDTRGMRRKKLLACVLLLTMFALMGRMVYVFWLEGHALCQALQTRLEDSPSAQMPCTKTSYPVGVTDWATAEETGGGVGRSTVRYQFDDDGDLLGVDSDHGDGGSAEVTYRCSTLGKILTPIVNYQAWSSYSTFEQLARGAAPQVERGTEDEGAGVPGLRTRLSVLGDPALGSFFVLEASTRDEDERLRRRVSQGMLPGRLTVSEYEYDVHGNLQSRHQIFVSHPYTNSRQTDYTYECWD